MEKRRKQINQFLKSNFSLIIVCFLAIAMSIFSVLISKYSDIPISIETIEDFKNIEKTGMNKRYIITGYLTFENWTPLGNSNNPFTGRLESNNPITIKSFDTNAKNIGIFSINKGIILGIKVYCPNLEQTYNNAETFGYFAGINYGKITSCNVYMGKTELSFKNSNDLSVGTFCGVNNGDVRKCISTNEMIIRTENLINFGYFCGKTNSGIIELCSAKGPTSVFANNAYCGGISGAAENTLFINNCVSNRFYFDVKEKIYIGGFVGIVTGKICTFKNSYNSLTVFNTGTSFELLNIGSVGLDLYAFSSILNCVSNLNAKISTNSFVYGTFYTTNNENVENSYFTSVISADVCLIQGTKKIFSQLSLSLLGWDSAIWRINSDGIECVIVYER